MVEDEPVFLTSRSPPSGHLSRSVLSGKLGSEGRERSTMYIGDAATALVMCLALHMSRQYW
jgi:hypothetical protein